MSQSWAGSDFSYDDMSRSDKWDQILPTGSTSTPRSADGLKTSILIDAIPFDDAPVVWGKERLRIREDSVLIEALYYDQDMQPLRHAMVTTEIGEYSAAASCPRTMRMMDLEKPDSFTEDASRRHGLSMWRCGGSAVYVVFAAIKEPLTRDCLWPGVIFGASQTRTPLTAGGIALAVFCGDLLYGPAGR